MLQRYLLKWNSRVNVPRELKKINSVLMGYELEVVKKESAPLLGNPVCNEIIKDLEDQNLLCKQDGSVYAEFVSLPMSLDNCLKHVQYICSLLMNKYPYFESWRGGKCGFHIHLNRRSVKDKKNLLEFFLKYRDYFETLSGRKNTYYCSFSSGSIRDNYNYPDSASRYVALNFKNRSTIEFRLWRGTLNPDTLAMYFKLTSTLGKLSPYLPELNFTDYLFLSDCDESALYKLDANLGGLLSSYSIDAVKRELAKIKTYFDQHHYKRNIKNLKRYKKEMDRLEQIRQENQEKLYQFFSDPQSVDLSTINNF